MQENVAPNVLGIFFVFSKMQKQPSKLFFFFF